MINTNERGGWIISAGAVVEEKHIPSFSVVGDGATFGDRIEFGDGIEFGNE